MISVTITGVRNPITQGLTIDFEIESKNPQLVTIDRKNDIPGLLIIKAFAPNQIAYNYVYITPNNGNDNLKALGVFNTALKAKFIKGDYHISFTPQNTIPKGGKIDIEFPENFYAECFDYLEPCEVSGAISTYASCSSISSLKYQIVLDNKLIVSPGISPIKIVFR